MRKKNKKRTQRSNQYYPKFNPELLSPQQRELYYDPRDQRFHKFEKQTTKNRITNRSELSDKNSAKSRFNTFKDYYDNYPVDYNFRRDLVCTRRKLRRVALFVSGKAGVGKPGPKIRIYNKDSKVRCK